MAQAPLQPQLQPPTPLSPPLPTPPPQRALAPCLADAQTAQPLPKGDSQHWATSAAYAWQHPLRLKRQSTTACTAPLPGVSGAVPRLVRPSTSLPPGTTLLLPSAPTTQHTSRRAEQNAHSDVGTQKVARRALVAMKPLPNQNGAKDATSARRLAALSLASVPTRTGLRAFLPHHSPRNAQLGAQLPVPPWPPAALPLRPQALAPASPP